MQIMKKTVIFLLLFISLFTYFYYRKYPLRTEITIRNHPIIVDLAVSQKEKERGLSGRKMLPSGHGMLFVYDHKETYGFWMKDMQFPLDFLWIDGKTVADITKNVQVKSASGAWITLGPRVPVDKVLEVNAGTIDALGISIGDSIEVKN